LVAHFGHDASYIQRKLGIGTTNPSAKLDVNGDTLLDGDAHTSGEVSFGGTAYDCKVWQTYLDIRPQFNFQVSDNNNYGDYRFYSEKRGDSNNRLALEYFGDGDVWRFSGDVTAHDTLRMTSGGNGENRFEVWDYQNNAPLTAMGYLTGLTPNNPDYSSFDSGTWGFWAKQGERMMIDGDVEYDGGDWIIEGNAEIKIGMDLKTGSPRRSLSIGTQAPAYEYAGEKGLFLYDGTTNNTVIGKVTNQGAMLSGAILKEGMIYSQNNNAVFGGNGLHIDWANERMSLGNGIVIDSTDPSITIGTGGELKGDNWYIDEEDWVHPSLGAVIWAKNSVADFGSTDEAGSITNNSWKTATTVAGEGAETSSQTKIRTRYYHKEGIKKLILNAQARTDNNTSEDAAFTNQVKLIVGGLSSIYNISRTGGLNVFTLEVDVSTLTADTYYVIEVELRAEVYTIGTGNIYSSTAQSFLREDAYILSSTT
jgi:hypothetical protein